MDGWIKLHRQILESPVFAHQTALKIWLWCLCKANHADRSFPISTGKGETIVKISRGQFIFGRFKAEDELGINGSTIYKWMHKFSDEMGMIKIESNTHYSIITILNFNDFQEIENTKITPKEHPKDKQVTPKGQPSNTYKNDNNEKNEYKDNEILIYGSTDAKYYIVTNPKYAYQKPAKVYGVDGLREFLQDANTDLPCSVEEATKFMRAKDKAIFDGDQSFVINSMKLFIEKQYA